MKKEKLSRTVRVKVFKFDGLSPASKEKAIEKHRYDDVDYDWWDLAVDGFKELFEVMGIEINTRKFSFSLNGNSRDGVGFDADVDLFKLIDSIANKSWEKEYPTLSENLNLIPCYVNKRVLTLLKNGNIDYELTVTANERPYYPKVNFGTSIWWKKHLLISVQIDILEHWIEKIIKEIGNYCHKQLEKERDWRTSNEQVVESIRANDREFTADGKDWY